MPERRIKLFCEGPHDHAFLDTLRLLGKLPDSIELEKRGFRPTGKDAIVDKTRTNLAAGLATIVVRDYDELRGIDVARWLANKIGVAGVTAIDGASDAFLVAAARPVVVIGVGHLGSTPREIVDVTRGTIDEYLFRFLLHRDIYEASSEISECPYDVWRAKLIETRALIEKNGLSSPTIKQLVRLPHLLSPFEGAPTTLTEKVLQSAAKTGHVESLSDPLRSAILRAVETVLAA